MAVIAVMLVFKVKSHAICMGGASVHHFYRETSRKEDALEP
jgi:hypothetical protein